MLDSRLFKYQNLSTGSSRAIYASSPSPHHLSSLCHPVPRLQHEAAGAVLAESRVFLFLEHADGFDGEVRAVKLRRVDDVTPRSMVATLSRQSLPHTLPASRPEYLCGCAAQFASAALPTPRSPRAPPSGGQRESFPARRPATRPDGRRRRLIFLRWRAFSSWRHWSKDSDRMMSGVVSSGRATPETGASLACWSG